MCGPSSLGVANMTMQQRVAASSCTPSHAPRHAMLKLTPHTGSVTAPLPVNKRSTQQYPQGRARASQLLRRVQRLLPRCRAAAAVPRRRRGSRRCGRRRARGTQVGEHAPRDASRVRLALRQVVGDAAGGAVQLRAAQLLRAHVLARGRLAGARAPQLGLCPYSSTLQ